MTGDFVKALTSPRNAEPGAEPEPTGDDYRAVWRTARPAGLDIRMGALQFSIQYTHIYTTVAASEFFSAFWIILPFATFVFEGEHLRDVVQSINERKARALYLFDPKRHASPDAGQARILRMQAVVASHDVAFQRAAQAFGFSAGTMQASPNATVPA